MVSVIAKDFLTMFSNCFCTGLTTTNGIVSHVTRVCLSGQIKAGRLGVQFIFWSVSEWWLTFKKP